MGEIKLLSSYLVWEPLPGFQYVTEVLGALSLHEELEAETIKHFVQSPPASTWGHRYSRASAAFSLHLLYSVLERLPLHASTQQSALGQPGHTEHAHHILGGLHGFNA